MFTFYLFIYSVSQVVAFIIEPQHMVQNHKVILISLQVSPLIDSI